MKLKCLIIIILFLFIGCKNDIKVKIKEVKLTTLSDDTSGFTNAINISKMTFDKLFINWLLEILKAEKPNKEIIAYKFGIFETPVSPSGYSIYLIGAKNYNSDDDDWAAGFGDYKPKNAYLNLPEKEFKNLKWEKVQERIENKVKEFIKSNDYKTSFLSSAKAITVGFDEGDLVRVK